MQYNQGLEVHKVSGREEGGLKITKLILPVCVILLILAVMSTYTIVQRKNVVRNAEQVTNQMVDYVAGNIANEIGYAKSSIKLSAISIAQTMTSEDLDNPAEVITPMVVNTEGT